MDSCLRFPYKSGFAGKPGEGPKGLFGAAAMLVYPRNYLKGLSVKKIALALVAVSALGLAACQPATEANNTVDTNTEEALNEAVEDVNAAGAAATNALDELSDAAANAGDAVENAADAAAEATENAVTK
jgi:hypothetical protein